MSKKELLQKALEYLKSLDNHEKDESYGTQQQLASYELENFLAWLGINSDAIRNLREEHTK